MCERERVRRVEPWPAGLIIGLDWAWGMHFHPWLGCLQDEQGRGAQAYAERWCENYELWKWCSGIGVGQAVSGPGDREWRCGGWRRCLKIHC